MCKHRTSGRRFCADVRRMDRWCSIENVFFPHVSNMHPQTFWTHNTVAVTKDNHNTFKLWAKSGIVKNTQTGRPHITCCVSITDLHKTLDYFSEYQQKTIANQCYAAKTSFCCLVLNHSQNHDDGCARLHTAPCRPTRWWHQNTKRAIGKHTEPWRVFWCHALVTPRKKLNTPLRSFSTTN